MKFFQGLMRIISSQVAAFVLILIAALIEYFSGAAPSDISAGLWGVISGAVIAALNFLFSLIKKPQP